MSTQILFGLPCPGCGLTRAGVYFLLGFYEQAWEMHPFIYGWVFVILCFFWQRYIRGKKLGRAFWILVGILIAGMVVFYVYRMYLYFPDKSPMTIGEDGIFSEYIKPFLPEAESDGNPYTN